MAAYTSALLRACSLCRRVVLPNSSTIRKTALVSATNKLTKRQLTTPPPQVESTTDGSNKPDYPAEFEVSYNEFKYVLPLLPLQTVPKAPEFASYPTPSGWFPPNFELRSKQKYLVRRTRNHMLPVYSETTKNRIEHIQTVQHCVRIRRIEGDIWALEADLRHHLQEKTGLKQIKTQVHEVGRFIKVRGMHADLIASFLFERGM